MDRYLHMLARGMLTLADQALVVVTAVAVMLLYSVMAGLADQAAATDPVAVVVAPGLVTAA